MPTEPLVALPEHPRLLTDADVVALFREKRKRVVTFLGFGELGYEDDEELRRLCERELRRHAPDDTIINTGTLVTLGFRRGIADVYEIARRMRFATTGIHPSVSLRSEKPHALSMFVDETFFVEDDSWGGLQSLNATPSPTLRALLAISDEVVVMGGGKHTAQELQAFLQNRTPVRFHALDMHHSTSEAWVRQTDADVGDFRGAAYHAWMSRTEHIVGTP